MSKAFFDNDTINNVIKNYLDRELAVFGEFRYAYIILNKRNPAELFAITNYPDQWVEIYKERNYQQIDPVVIFALNRVSPFEWDESLSINYNVVNGYTFVLHDYNNRLAMLSIMMVSSEVVEIKKKIKEHKNDLHMLLLDVHEKITSLYREMIRQNYQNPASGKECFSPRENEILYWASMGKTYSEIATILGIKLGTVKFHIGSVVKKLGVMNAKHAIRLGVELQLIKPVSK
ncbi:helix-turn-helix transcriptional regulator [Arsenophonus nasoniae]|uniref:LuxR family transcriptional regulator n=1 Tax=Arsenophonus nasoniae TaxID=638 RepID=A0AA95KDU5_9GAMM|nr:LuxR family transcriptional regulator [Arsenophonus nasoniae]WGM02138.1 LuxR family transcriptional regulator [Arsenophonus nasoniae]